MLSQAVNCTICIYNRTYLDIKEQKQIVSAWYRNLCISSFKLVIIKQISQSQKGIKDHKKTICNGLRLLVLLMSNGIYKSSNKHFAS
jgi:hypothetical protein